MSGPAPFPEPIYVTRPLLPPLDEYRELLEQIWASGWLSNNGKLHQTLETELSSWLRAPYLSLFNNGTLALLVACQALRVSGEVITTPFTFPATPHVLSWNNVTPVFADIDPQTMTLDPARIEQLITGRTSAILAVHVYGIPCDVVGLQAVADAYGLKLIYDAAHAFGTEIDGRPITDFGDATMLSFHATKLFHSAEGGALAVRTPDLKRRIDLLKNFGIKNENEVMMPGINGKMNELQAALGLVVLRHLDAERMARAAITEAYRERLDGLDGIECVRVPPGVRDSYQYFVIRVSGGQRDRLHEQLKAYNVVTRRYFHPLCSDYSCYRMLPSARPEHVPVAQRIAGEVLVLPLYGALGVAAAQRICDAIEYVLQSA